jgi:UDP-N-acetylmuramoyl-L-alanyl-D-glutamate--2,6-diaminopimelate ligase
MLSSLKRLIPKPLFSAYHWSMALLAAAWYHCPSKELVVIGVTGTNGKTTTANLIAAILEAAGEKVGLTSTANFRIAGEEQVNALKMTMPGRFFLQRMLRRMVTAGCRYAVIETSSQGIAQFRHLGIEYDIAVFTNLTPEHIEAHGGFENYKRAKLMLFQHVSHDARKRLPDRGEVMKTIVVNLESEYAWEFLDHHADQKYGYLIEGGERALGTEVDWPLNFVKALGFSVTPTGSTFSVHGTPFELKLPGRYNALNALAAIAVGLSHDVGLETMSQALAKVEFVPGRFERIEEGQDFQVIVDYAPEPESMRQLYGVIDVLPKSRLIHVLGSAGGGRDKSRRPVLGEFAGRRADVVIVTNEDPYDEDPQVIIDAVATGALQAGKREGHNLFSVLDRREAIAQAINLAGPGDLVLLTGKGSEQAIMGPNGTSTPWDERQVARDLLRLRLARH